MIGGRAPVTPSAHRAAAKWDAPRLTGIVPDRIPPGLPPRRMHRHTLSLLQINATLGVQSNQTCSCSAFSSFGTHRLLLHCMCGNLQCLPPGTSSRIESCRTASLACSDRQRTPTTGIADGRGDSYPAELLSGSSRKRRCSSSGSARIFVRRQGQRLFRAGRAAGSTVSSTFCSALHVTTSRFFFDTLQLVLGAMGATMPVGTSSPLSDRRQCFAQFQPIRGPRTVSDCEGAVQGGSASRQVRTYSYSRRCEETCQNSNVKWKSTPQLRRCGK